MAITNTHTTNRDVLYGIVVLEKKKNNKVEKGMNKRHLFVFASSTRLWKIKYQHSTILQLEK